MGVLSRVLAALSSSTGEEESVQSVSGALKVYVADEAGADFSNGTKLTEPNGYDYEDVAASQSAQVLGAAGAIGDLLERLICVVSTAATAQVQLTDGSGAAFTIFPNSPGGGIGTYVIRVGARSMGGAWKVTTAAGVAVRAVGRFS